MSLHCNKPPQILTLAFSLISRPALCPNKIEIMRLTDEVKWPLLSEALLSCTMTCTLRKSRPSAADLSEMMDLIAV